MGQRRSRGDGSVYFDAANGVWVGAVDLGRDDDGVRRRRKVSGRTKTAALARMRELRRRLDDGEVVTHDKTTVQLAMEDFLARGLPAKLASNTRYVLTLYGARFTERVGGRTLRALTTRDVEDFLQALADEGKAHRTLIVARSVPARCLDHAIRQGWLPAGRNVATLARIPETVERKLRPVLSDTDVRALLEAAKGERWEPLLATVAITGCRIGEAIAQAWSEIDTDRNLVHITAGVRHEADGSLSRREPKKNSHRTVEVPPALIQTLQAHRRRVVAEALAAGRPAPDLAFPTAAGSMVHRRNLDRWLDRIAKAAGVKVKGWHDLRHALATGLGDDGVPVTRTASVLGHRNIDTTTRVYTHPTEAADAAVARGLRLLSPDDQGT
ncbi:MAG: integrase [Frankiaceae bacterium]|nr:integrase [Frankiaceae bacterium]